MSSTQSLPIEISNLCKSYGSFKALDDVSLNIAAGEFLTLLGPSGSGKTTLLMALAGFVRPNGGSIRFGDREMIATPPHKRGLGMVFQSYALFPFMTVAENVAYPLKIRGVSKTDQKTRAERALACSGVCLNELSIRFSSTRSIIPTSAETWGTLASATTSKSIFFSLARR